MQDNISQLITTARQAMRMKDWRSVDHAAQQILMHQSQNAEGYYLAGVVKRVERNQPAAIDLFEKGLELDPTRHDIAVELANMYSVTRRNGDAAKILKQYEGALNNSPRYLDLAGTIYTEIGLSERALPLFRRAHELQPEADIFTANLATCAVFVGNIEEGRNLYLGLLEKFPEHRKNHYQLSRLKKAEDFQHIDQMKDILENSKEPVARDIPLLFAIAKELEDLEQWDDCFDYYTRGCDAVSSVAQYDVATDVELVDTIIEIFNRDWFATLTSKPSASKNNKAPIFIVGLPRTGTTLVERIVSSHSEVSSLGETLFLQMAIMKQSGLDNKQRVDRDVLLSVASKDSSNLADDYLSSVAYRLGEQSMFIEKLPLNFLYVGLVAKAWPEARIIHMVRDPMDACFAMYKQVFTWAYKYSYSLTDLAAYYVAYDRLRSHWQQLLGNRFIEVQYELLVSDQESQTRNILERLGLPFEQACLDFEKNQAPSATASSVQVRDKVHTGSVQKWKRFEKQLSPLRDHLLANGISFSKE